MIVSQYYPSVDLSGGYIRRQIYFSSKNIRAYAIEGFLVKVHFGLKMDDINI
jgi:hypothetical protein